ncbi:MAG TPA: PVC-type heme-binding CxxCH protein [Planctomycetota bacterium]|nr:PVC-type heme-binding CxxCH protein [Planctomycetota bacterium]
MGALRRTPAPASSLLAAAVLAAAASAQTSTSPAQEAANAVPRLELRRGDRIALIGNALAERMQHHGWLEARLQARFPELELTVRNRGFAADEVSVQQRTAGFGSRDEHLERTGASVVFVFHGFVESFRGPEGVEGYEAELAELVRHLRVTSYDGEGPPRVVLFASVPFEDLGDPLLPDPEQANRRIRLYDDATARVALAESVPFVDLGSAMLERYAAAAESLTIDGIHLRAEGNRALAEVIEQALFGPAPAPDPRRLEELRALVLEKNRIGFDRYRAADGYNVYGGRSSLEYEGITNFDVLQRELAILDAMAANLDRRIWALAKGEDSARAAKVEVPPPIPVPTNRPGAGPGGAHRFLGGREALGRMNAAEGLEVTLFASEEDFPELANPVQMAFDPRGRLWVAAWPSYPHRRADEPPHDKLLVLEDADGDGRAERCSVFAGDLHNPTGFELFRGGVVVANAPDLFFLRDEDGDGTADSTERILHGLSSADTHHTANSFVLGPDGALYFQEGIFHQTQIETVHGPVRNENACVWRFEPRTGRVERWLPYPFLNPHGHVFDRWGQDFVTDGTGNENFFALPLSGHLEAPARHPATQPFFPQRSRPAAATEILSSRHFPEAMQGAYLVANVIGFQGIHAYRLEERGSGFSASEIEPIVVSTDPNFRPVDLEVGPDGALYFLDWHNPLIGHMQHHLRDPNRDHAHGRVYRVTARGRPLLEASAIAGRPLDELLELLRSPEDRVRYRVRVELSARDSAEVVAAARAWAAGLDPGDPEREHHLLEALWTQQQHGALDRDLLDRLLASPEPRARAAATRVLRHMRREVDRLLEHLRELVRDDHPRVRLEAVVALSSFPQPEAAEIALLALERETDRFLDYALEETLRALEPQWRPAIAAGAPIAGANQAGLARLLARLDTAELARAIPGEAVFVETLARHDADDEDLTRAVHRLAELRGSTPARELVAAIDRADAREGGHADHLLQRLFAVLGSLPASERAPLAAELRVLAKEGRRPSTRRLATAARLEAEGSADVVWREASSSPSELLELLEAAPYLRDRVAAQALFRRALALLDTPPTAAGDGSAPKTAAGRYVRIELPGPRRTLTLAEVEVLSGGENVAPRGRATQSSLAWDGVPERALDGNRSGRYGDGGQTHTAEDRPDPWWELDLGEELAIDAVVLWNRGEDGGRYAARLDGHVVRVLDSERRTVGEHRGDSAAPERIEIELTAPALRLRRAAARALASLGVREADAVAALLERFADADLRPAVAEALRSVPVDRWPPGAPSRLANDLLAALAAGRDAPNGAPAGASPPARPLLALADDLAPHLEPELAARLRAARRRFGPRIVVIRPVPDRLLYDRASFTVAAGRAVELVFENVDIMPHNLVLTAPGALAKVGLAAERMAAEPDAWERAFVPALPEVLFATRLLQPGGSETLRFTAPDQVGEHPYVCTFPGHWVRMNGTMIVVGEGEEPADDTAEPTPASAVPPRLFVRTWTLADLAPHLAELPSRSPARGRAILEAASCLSCHSVAGEGGSTGPELEDVTVRYSAKELLVHVLEPSASILEGYEAELFVLTSGRAVSGRVMAEEPGLLLVRDDPYRDDLLELPLADIEERRPATLSTMPEGLLSTFERDEILDLLAYLESLRAKDE